jgi:hypothetical protein
LITALIVRLPKDSVARATEALRVARAESASLGRVRHETLRAAVESLADTTHDVGRAIDAATVRGVPTGKVNGSSGDGTGV